VIVHASSSISDEDSDTTPRERVSPIPVDGTAGVGGPYRRTSASSRNLSVVHVLDFRAWFNEALE
jgi:hypothetical protein